MTKARAHWRWRLQNDPERYDAAAKAYTDAVCGGRAEWFADKLADEAADNFKSKGDQTNDQL